MAEIMLEPTAIAAWQRLVQGAARRCALSLDETCEAHLVFTLARGLRDAPMTGQAMALPYLAAMQVTGGERRVQLEMVGDGCLVIAGLFPGIARRRRLRATYYIDLGRSAYQEAAVGAREGQAALLSHLVAEFPRMVSVLGAVRECLPGGLWERAARAIGEDAGSLPLDAGLATARGQRPH
ncbi:hypothetical protein J2T57_001585 [Natronocella acetinitrilica]|uniref:Uncharacterized protein n=1 Tax=Natronocella acetinitrilica TaxID=414046 RepID=A0AAE3G3G8_9GAMM|nr:hypothetical protein [Natronocella acetinitrilica]MCP1674483.1 hypothetical protein [Natronocella acetinitrilica]